jgi:hypothetical protein
MRGWLADSFRSLGAPWVWNARKTLFVLRGRRGQCPCHNPSDSGLPGETRCEAATYWNDPARFSRLVCPLLREVPDGHWRCSVRAGEVRSFWLRPLGLWAATLGVAVLLVGGSLWGTMRAVGFEVGLRQVFWPPAWRELRTVRADFFRRQAEDHLQAGRIRDAIAALRVANDLGPRDYDTGMLAAQLNHLVRPEQADAEYRRLYDLHPERRGETAQVWLRSMLARAHLRGVALLARRRLVDSPDEWPVWTHALLVAVRGEQRWEVLEAVVGDTAAPAPARQVADLELRVRRMEPADARRKLAGQAAPAEPYAALHRIALMVEFGDGLEALQALADSGGVLAPRDHVRLALAAHAVARNRAALEREIEALLARPGAEGEAGLTLVGLHLIGHPDPVLLEQARAALLARPARPAPDGGHAAAALYAAAVLDGPRDWTPALRDRLPEVDPASATARLRLEEALIAPGGTPLLLLGSARPLSLELNYAVLERARTSR